MSTFGLYARLHRLDIVVRADVHAWNAWRAPFPTGTLGPSDIPLRHDRALLDPCDGKLQRFIARFLRIGEVPIDAERACFAGAVGDDGRCCIATTAGGGYHRPDLAAVILDDVVRLHTTPPAVHRLSAGHTMSAVAAASPTRDGKLVVEIAQSITQRVQ
ncbi:hypothetical protein Bamb_6396 [Burkholderia ambifaria AMMD]|uniref:Uncharacterized protein n=1 Tax=Burkholderia ambifaria (strain ATCC BAA-244 / DSM 16087 / CCUG 44356 / LMG 19182 / AMMD) TaxID=339670 RepID=Q0B1N3_BURCM|nr:hypothetical protein Bamb_6396 [Burkholderia ambifaria AMMD]